MSDFVVITGLISHPVSFLKLSISMRSSGSNMATVMDFKVRERGSTKFFIAKSCGIRRSSPWSVAGLSMPVPRENRDIQLLTKERHHLLFPDHSQPDEYLSQPPTFLPLCADCLFQLAGSNQALLYQELAEFR